MLLRSSLIYEAAWMPPTMIETPRLLLRPFVLSDAAVAYEWLGDAVVMRYTPSGPDASLQQTTERIVNYQRHHAANGFSKWVIVDRQTQRAIGDSGLLLMPESGDIELGFRLARPWWGKGLATEASRGWVRTAFEDFRLSRLTAFAHPENRASLRVLAKVGFSHERADTVFGMQSLVFSLVAGGAKALQ